MPPIYNFYTVLSLRPRAAQANLELAENALKCLYGGAFHSHMDSKPSGGIKVNIRDLSRIWQS